MLGTLIERRNADRAEMLRTYDVNGRLDIAKDIEQQAKTILSDASEKLRALAIELDAKTGFKITSIDDDTDAYTSDLLGDTFGYAVSKIENEI